MLERESTIQASYGGWERRGLQFQELQGAPPGTEKAMEAGQAAGSRGMTSEAQMMGISPGF